MARPSKKTIAATSDEVPASFCDSYLLPEYTNHFIQFLDDAQWLVVQENSPIVKDAFGGIAPYALPESFGRSVNTTGSEENSMHIQTTRVESEFTLTKEQVLSGDYTVFVENIAENLPRILTSIESTVVQSLQDQGAFTKLDHTADFWDQFLSWMEKSSLKFDHLGRVSFDHLQLFGAGDTSWATNTSPTPEQIQQWHAIVDHKRTEHFAKIKQNELQLREQTDDSEQIQKLIQLIQRTEHEQYLKQYGTPEYERTQVFWMHRIAQHEILQSPSLAGYHQSYIKLGMHEVSSTGAINGVRVQLPQTKIEISEHMPIQDVLAGNYNNRFASVKEQIAALKPTLMQDAVESMKQLQEARGSESGLSVVEHFDWDIYLDNLEQKNLVFDLQGNVTLPQVVTSNTNLAEMTAAQRARFEKIINDKWKENNARRTSSRRLSEQH